MSSVLNIRPAATLDLLSLGALVHRLDPGIVPFRKAHHCDIHVSGGEFNVAANLADCFRLQTGIATAMVDYPIGDLIAERVRAMGVKPFYKQFKHDGVQGPNMAAVYSDRGQGVRAPVVFYNRCNEAPSSPLILITAISFGAFPAASNGRLLCLTGLSKTLMCWWAMKRTCKWAWECLAPRSLPNRNSILPRFWA